MQQQKTSTLFHNFGGSVCLRGNMLYARTGERKLRQLGREEVCGTKLR